jgi:hypothetical protein
MMVVACYSLFVSEQTAASAAKPGGTTTTLPLNDNARRRLQKNIRTGRVFLLLGVLTTAGVIVGIVAAKTAAFICLLPAAGYFAWAFYKFSIESARDLRVGTMERYQGPWQERTFIKMAHTNPQYRLYVQPPTLEQPVMIRRTALVRSVRQAGVNDEWVSGSGQLEYTTRSRQPLTYSRHPTGR